MKAQYRAVYVVNVYMVPSFSSTYLTGGKQCEDNSLKLAKE